MLQTPALLMSARHCGPLSVIEEVGVLDVAESELVQVATYLGRLSSHETTTPMCQPKRPHSVTLRAGEVLEGALLVCRSTAAMLRREAFNAIFEHSAHPELFACDVPEERHGERDALVFLS